MVRRKQVLAESLTDLIASGLGGRMHAGDRLGFWTFNEKVYSERILSQTWTPEASRAVADQAGRSLRSQWFEKQTRLDTAIAEIQKAAKASKFLTVILLSDGDSPMVGTPFDRSVNLVYREHFRELQRARKPFITTLVAREGQFVAWAVAVGGGGIKIPEAPDSLRIARSEETNATPSAPIAASNQVPKTVVKEAPRPSLPIEQPMRTPSLEVTGSLQDALPAPVENRPVESLEKPQDEKRSESSISRASSRSEGSAVAATPLAGQESPSLARHPKPSAEDEALSIPRPPDPTAPSDSTSAPAMTIPTPPPPRPEKSASNSSARSESRAPASKAVEPASVRDPRAQDRETTSSATSATEAPAQQLAAAAPKDSPSRGLASLLAGLALLAIALGLLTWSIRNYRPHSQPSIISRSMDGKAPRRRF